MDNRWIGEGASNNEQSGNLIASYTYSNPNTWQNSSVSINTTTSVITVTGGTTLANGDKVVLTPTTSAMGCRQQDIMPGGTGLGTVFYVQQLSGNSFRISTDASGSSLVSISNSGTAGAWQLETLGSTSSVVFSGLNEKSVRIIIKDGGSSGNYGLVSVQVNGWGSASAPNQYASYPSSGPQFGSTFDCHVWSSTCPYKILAKIDLYCRDNMVFMSSQTNIEYPNSATGSYASTSSSTTNGQSSTPNTAVFDSINSITIGFGNQSMTGNLTVEVYRL